MARPRMKNQERAGVAGGWIGAEGESRAKGIDGGDDEGRCFFVGGEFLDQG